MNRFATLAAALAATLFAEEALAAKLIVILPLDVRLTKGKLDDAAQGSLEETLRDLATNALAQEGWTVLSGENTIAVLRDNGVSPEQCGEQSCHLAMARELKADKFLSGSVQYVDGMFNASIRLIDTRTGSIVASQHLTGKTATALREEMEAKVDSVFQKAKMLVTTQPESKQAAPERPASSESGQGERVTLTLPSISVATPTPPASLKLTPEDLLGAKDKLASARRFRIAGWTMFALANVSALATMGLGFSSPDSNTAAIPGLLSVALYVVPGPLFQASNSDARDGLSFFGAGGPRSVRWAAGWFLYGFGQFLTIGTVAVDGLALNLGGGSSGGVIVGALEFMPFLFTGIGTLLLGLDAGDRVDQLSTAVASHEPAQSHVDVRLDMFASRGAIGPSLTVRW